MAKKIKFELNLPGLNEVMKSKPMQEILDRKGEEVARAAGEGFGHRTHLASWVAITNVYAETRAAREDNLKNNTLIKNLFNSKG